ncbi:MAG: Crp/Fnr family transcriptional regulator [Candidatus Saccharimonadales bacterium]
MDSFKKFVSNYHIKRFAKGELILVQGEVPEVAYVVKSGVVKTYNITSQGEEKPLTFDIQNEMLPLAWIFSKAQYANYYYEAFTDCELYCIPRDDIPAFIKGTPTAFSESFDYFVDRYLNFQMQVNALEQSKAASKVLNTIHFLCLRFGKDIEKNVVLIQLPLTQQDLANFMGLTRETTGIELKKLQRLDILSYKRQNYIVKTDKLDELLDEDYDHGLLNNGNVIIN